MSERTRVQRHPELAVPEQAAAIMAEGMVAHVAFCRDGQPFVIPFSYHYEPARPDRLYLHGALASRTLRHLADGAPVCVEVTLLDGLVYSRTALNHGVHYRSVVAFGHARAVTDEAEKATMCERMVERYFPGRKAGRDYEAAPIEQLRSTAVLEIHIEEWSAKARAGGPRGPKDADPDAPGTCGVVELPGTSPASASRSA